MDTLVDLHIHSKVLEKVVPKIILENIVRNDNNKIRVMVHDSYNRYYVEVDVLRDSFLRKFGWIGKNVLLYKNAEGETIDIPIDDLEEIDDWFGALAGRHTDNGK
jgi:hypothetical protein